MHGPQNLITEVPGIRVGNAHDARLASGVTVALLEEGAVVSCVVAGGAPGTRETDLLDPAAMVRGVDAIVLSGGSAFGLDAASGVQAFLRENGRGLTIGTARVPLVAQAILFDLLNSGCKEWGRYSPYRELGYAAAASAADVFELGTAGAGFGATTFDLKGGLGSASALTPSGYRVGALAAVNAIGSAVIGGGPFFWAAPLEVGGEFGGLGAAPALPGPPSPGWKGGPQPGTTIAIVATDAALSKAMAKRLAAVAQGGLAKALSLSHALFDGDAVFAVATGRGAVQEESNKLIEIGAFAADCLARAIARGVYEATALPFSGALPAWRDRFASPSMGEAESPR